MIEIRYLHWDTAVVAMERAFAPSGRVSARGGSTQIHAGAADPSSAPSSREIASAIC
jgi:hypothetical protein